MTTTTLTISSAVGESITVTTAGDDGDYEVDEGGWDPQPLPIENTYAQSQTADGADVSTSVRRLGACALTVRCIGTDLDEAWIKATALQKVVEVDDGTGWDGDPNVVINEAITDRTTVTHDCFRAAANIIRDPVLLDDGVEFRVTVTLPCWRRTWVQAPEEP